MLGNSRNLNRKIHLPSLMPRKMIKQNPKKTTTSGNTWKELFFGYLKHENSNIDDSVGQNSVTFYWVFDHESPTWGLDCIPAELMAINGWLNLEIRVRPFQNQIVNVEGVACSTFQNQLVVDVAFRYSRDVFHVITDCGFYDPLAAESWEPCRLIVQLGDKIICSVGLKLRI